VSIDQEATTMIAKYHRSLSLPSRYRKLIGVVEAAIMVVDVSTADNAASTHVPELLTWRDDRERDFCGELSPPSHPHIYTSWPHKHEDRRARCR
jgi:hypothetical protein